MVILFFFAFLSGLVTIFAPCIWPILPIILSASATGGHRKPLGITLGVIISFAALTLSISYIVKIIPFDTNLLRYFAAFVIGVLGLSLLIPAFSKVLEGFVSRLSGKVKTGDQAGKTGFGSGFVTGLALGVVWAPCAGPILATIAVLSATQKVTLDVVLVTVFYVLGIGIPLFIFATLGRFIFTKSRKFSKYTGQTQKVFGVIMVVTALLIAVNYDKVIEAKLLNSIPSYGSFLNAVEGNKTVTSELNKLKGQNPSAPISSDASNSSLFNTDYSAPDFAGISNWLNPDSPVHISDLKGKVVLVDFWTYTCINCIRTLPFVTSWYDKYHDKGFEVIGIHTPEFDFEKNTQNVLSAISQYKIHYPVGQDNDYATWNNYSNQYWPAEYLIDAKGTVRRTHFGEGEYDQMEKAIQVLLEENGKKAQMPLETMKSEIPSGQISPETYLGAARMQYLYPNGSTETGRKKFILSNNIPVNSFSYGGEWTINNEDAVAGSSAQILYNFQADKVFIILRPAENVSGLVKVYLDGALIDESVAGTDVKNGVVTVDSDRLYNIVDLHGKGGQHTVRLDFQTPGVQAFTFTFG